MKPNIPVRLSVARCEHSAYAEYGFNQYHYLKGINKSARCFLFYLNGKPAGFCAVINQTFKGCHNGVRFHRIVVLPQFSQRGLGGIICDFIAGVFQNSGYQMYMTCQSAALGAYLEKHPKNWKATANNKRKRKNNGAEGKRYRNRIEDICFCYKYAGKKIVGYENLLSSISIQRECGTLYVQKGITEGISRLQKKQNTTNHKKVKSSFAYRNITLSIMANIMMESQSAMFLYSDIISNIDREFTSEVFLKTYTPPHDSHGRSISNRMFSG